MPDKTVFRAGDHQLIGDLFVGNAQPKGKVDDDLFNVTRVVKGTDAAVSVEETGCKMAYPS
jgi:branched-chain amino acid transport system substrate-binding protein